MSAFQVSENHIGAIVRWYVEVPRPYTIDADDAPALMQELATENNRSVCYRYPAGPLPGDTPIDNERAPITCDPDITKYPKLTQVELLKALDCLEYQSCEHPEWNTSKAHQALEHMRGLAIANLPGYDAAPWGIE